MTVPQRVLDLMHSPGVYFCGDPEMDQAQREQLDLLYDINQTRQSDPKRRELLSRFFAETGDGLYIESPLHANWGCSTHWGSGCYANFNLTLVDDGEIFIGDHTLIGPNVTLVTTGHPIRPDLRERYAQFSEPIHIGRNVWIGANVTVLPGVTIGDNTVIGACSLVTKDIPASVVAIGQPARVLREINDHDRDYYWRDRRIPAGI
ncbi:sugar O-acetyltransferase [Bifidobacterium biavatii]|uniref:Galactoside O-acetyltransferase n=1 Tax=Bifidobacterium biavatii DSM 23969 TaxID=1437608 RepID=A0A086ZKH0_9BIFI|nr:galactoside O-acetyltransferase [Bifidobacterium biavatii DSM 23969]